MDSKRRKFTVDAVVDRISELPEDVLQNILSFLPTKQVFQSTLLCRRWKHVWTTFPILKFDENPMSWSSEKKNKSEVKIMRSNFYKFLTKCLRLRSRQSQRPHIKNFSLDDSLQNHNSKSRVDRWIRFVVESNVEELILFFGGSRIRYPLPHGVLVAKSLTVLTLEHCKLDSIRSDINLPSLKKLSLLEVYADNQIIQNLIFGCPMIEFMEISSCLGIKCLKIFGLPKVMKIRVENNDLGRLELEASNLHNLYIYECEISELNLLPLKNLKMLYISTPIVTEKWLDDHLSGLPLLENLELDSCDMLERIKLSSHHHHHLKSLELLSCHNLVEVMIDSSTLCRLICSGKTAKSFSLNAPGLLYAEYTKKRSTFYGPWDAEKIEFISKMGNSKVFKLSVNEVEDVIIRKELRETLPSPLYNVKHLELSIPPPFTGYKVEELLDCLLWISPLPDMLVIVLWEESDSDFDKIAFEFSYQKPIYKEENPSCCKFLPFPCWRHCLKTVKIESHKGHVDREILYKYFSKNAKTLENFLFHIGGNA